MIAIKTAVWAWKTQKKNILPELEKDSYKEKNGLEQLKVIFSLFGKLLENQTEFLRFIYFFDSYIIRQKIESDRLCEYEALIKTVQKLVFKAIHKGLEDGSINSKYTSLENELYFTLMHTMFSTIQKLSLSGKMLKMNSLESEKKQIELLTEILITG